MRRVFINPSDISGAEILIRDSGERNHLFNALRMKPGQRMLACDGEGWEYLSEIVSFEDGCIKLRILDKQRDSVEPRLKITLFQGIPKQGKMETVIQKSVELGVSEVAPVYTARSVPAEGSVHGDKLKRWRRVAEEAGKQSKRGIIPAINAPVGLGEIIQGLDRFGLVLFPYEEERDITIKEAIRGWRKDLNGVGSGAPFDETAAAIIIGPEGGFGPEEARALIDAGAIACSLGKTILRTETAGIAAIAMVMYELEL